LAKNFVPFLYRRLTEVQSLSTITPLLMGVFVYARHTPDSWPM